MTATATAARMLPLLPTADHAPGSATLPPLYEAWLLQLGVAPLPSEDNATCSSCAMCSRESTAERDATSFDPGVKCCSFLPALPNFLVGMILSDGDSDLAEGRNSILRRLADPCTATPLGLGRRSDYGLLYDSGTGFGRSEALLCPHYVSRDGGLCGIWRYRNAVCATWYCKHVRGQVGQRLWQKTRDMLQTVESYLALWCVLQIDTDGTLGRTPGELNAPTTRERVTQALVPAEARTAARAAWGEWSGREADFYLRCAALVRDLTWADVERHCGVQLTARVRDLKRSHEDANSPMPGVLKVGSFSVTPGSTAELRVVTYSSYDPLMVTKEVLTALPHFDGKTPTDDVVKTILENEGIELDDEVLRRFIDHGLLVSA